jgi:hypothetical protein
MTNHQSVRRRCFLATSAALGVASLVCRGKAMAGSAGLPGDNPAKGLDLAWTDEIKWDKVIDVTKVPGKNWNERLDQAQQAIVEQGGGVNRLPDSSDANFTMKGYVMQGRSAAPTVTYDVVFDYNNRPGIRVQEMCIGAPGGEEPSGTPESHPWGFRKGFVIRDNYIYSTGRTAIAFTGDGTQCLHNVVRFPKDVWRQTNTGLRATSGSSTNDNRAVEMRGYRWHAEGNDYVVRRNWAADRKYCINDGEGLMHDPSKRASRKENSGRNDERRIVATPQKVP